MKYLKRLMGKEDDPFSAPDLGPVYYNPLYQPDEEHTFTNPLFDDSDYEDSFSSHSYGRESKQVATPPSDPKPGAASEQTHEPDIQFPPVQTNSFTVIGGLPSRASVLAMSGAIKAEKLGKHPNFTKALDALDNYQILMATQVDLSGEGMFSDTIGIKTDRNYTRDKVFQTENYLKCVEELADVIQFAEAAVKESTGLFGRRSSNVRALAPAFASLLTKAYAMMPKVAAMQDGMASMGMMMMQKEGRSTFTFDELIKNSGAVGAFGDTLARTDGLDSEEDISIQRRDIKDALKPRKKDGVGERAKRMADIAKNAARVNRVTMPVPRLPVGAVNADLSEEEQISQANTLADRYIRMLRITMVAADDVGEAFLSGDGQRGRAQQAKIQLFPYIKLVGQAMSNRSAIVSAIRTGVIEPGSALEKVAATGMMSLADASAQLKAEFDQNFGSVRGTLKKDQEGPQGYKAMGGQMSQSVLDFAQGKVLRSGSKDVEDDKERNAVQKQSNGGMYDEAVAKVDQLLGFGVVANAEAKNFYDHEGRAQLGGSMMDIAQGKTAGSYRMVMTDMQREMASASSKTIEPENLINIYQQGSLLASMMKMSVVDYICHHTDRNIGNFMIHKDESTGQMGVTAIDNDQVFGESPTTAAYGAQTDYNVAATVGERGKRTFGNEMRTYLHMVTPEVQQALASLDLQALDSLLEPYVQRVPRLAALQRAKELKDCAASAPVVDLQSTEGVKQYMDGMINNAFEDFIKKIVVSKDRTSADIPNANYYLGNHIVRDVVNDIASKYAWIKPNNIAIWLKALGIPRERAVQMMVQNMQVEGGGEPLTEEELLKMERADAFAPENYSLPVKEFREKYAAELSA